MFKFISNSTLDRLLDEEKQSGMILQKEKDARSKQYLTHQLAVDFLYKPVYCFSNEWEDPIVGFVTYVDLDHKKGSPLYTIFNWLTGDFTLSLHPRIWCNMDFTNNHECSGVLPLMDINPYHRWNLMNVHYSQIVMDRKVPEQNEEPQLMTRSEMYKELTVTGYFDTIEKMLKAESPNLARSILLSIVSDHESDHSGLSVAETSKKIKSSISAKLNNVIY